MSSQTPARPRLAILFWYYKAPAVCRSRVRALRRLHPTTAIYGLYGGEPEGFAEFADLGDWLDDNWCFDAPRDAEWKWLHGDLMIGAWFEQRGRALPWDSIAVVQWDMLVCTPLDQVFDPLQTDDVYLPGVRPVDEVRRFWWWAQPGTEREAELNAFHHDLRRQHPEPRLLACQFLCAVLPRRFLECYGSMPNREHGFLEYKLPSCAEAFGFTLRQYAHLPVTWPNDPPEAVVVLSARKEAIRPRDILRAWLRPRGVRLFHPVHEVYRQGMLSVAAAAARETLREGKQRMKARVKRTVWSLRGRP